MPLSGSHTTVRRLLTIFMGDGEPQWSIGVTWADGSAYGCYPVSCTYGEFGEGRITPRNSQGEPLSFIFVEQNFDRFPESVSLRAYAYEDDNDALEAYGLPRFVECVTSGGCTVGEESPLVWRVPRGVEPASQRLTLRGRRRQYGVRERARHPPGDLSRQHTLSGPRRNVPRSTWR